MTTTVRAYIGLGANLGDREARLLDALDALDRTPDVRVVATSSLYETDPVGPPPQGPYLNGAAALDTALAARALLERLHEIEAAAGRERRGVPRWSARTLDLDLLLFGDAVIDEPGLVVPHPRMHERGFVLVPLADIARDVRHPGLGERIGALERRVREPGAVRPWQPPRAGTSTATGSGSGRRMEWRSRQ